MHMVFECTLYQHLRQHTRFAPLFSGAASALPPDQRMAAFMQQEPRRVAAFVHACWLMRVEQLDSLVEMVGPGVVADTFGSDRLAQLGAEADTESELSLVGSLG